MYHRAHYTDAEIKDITNFSLGFISKITRDYWKQKMKNK